MEQKQEQQDGNNFASLAIGILVVVVILWVLLGLVALNIKWVVGWFSPALANSINPGTFGDMFGAANALFSALAIGGVVLTLWVQIKELKEARDDRKANLLHQETIAKSQERAAQMQLKVAQSGDVYASYARVAGSEFIKRIQRLHWFVDRFGTGNSLKDIKVANVPFERLESLMEQAQGNFPPRHYSRWSVPAHEVPEQGSWRTVLETRFIEDVQECVSAIVAVRPVFKLGLMEPRDFRGVLNPADCRFVLQVASRALASCDHEIAVINEVAKALEGDAARKD